MLQTSVQGLREPTDTKFS